MVQKPQKVKHAGIKLLPLRFRQNIREIGTSLSKPGLFSKRLFSERLGLRFLWQRLRQYILYVGRPRRKRFLLPRQVKCATSWDCAKCSSLRKDLHLHVLCFGGRPPCPRNATVRSGIQPVPVVTP